MFPLLIDITIDHCQTNEDAFHAGQSSRVFELWIFYAVLRLNLVTGAKYPEFG